MMYRDALGRATEAVNLKDLGIDNMSCSKGLTGAFIWQIRGKGANEKADRVAEAFKSAVPGTKITRPLHTNTIRLVGLDASANGTIIRNALLQVKSGTDPNLIKIGEIRIDRSRLGEAIVSAPVPVTRAALERGKIAVRLTTVRVHELRQRPLRCHRCLARGHVAAMCPAAKPKTDLCYVCGKPGHLVKTCTDKTACPVCTDVGRKPTNHRAGSWDPHKVTEKTGKKTVKVTKKSIVHEDMEVEQGVPGTSIGDLLAQRMREDRVELAVIAEPWWVPPGDERWFSSLGGTSLSAVLVGESRRLCSLVRRGLFYVAVKWGNSLVVSVYFPPSENINMFSRLLDELKELLGTFPALPALMAGDFNARFSRWDPEGRSNRRDLTWGTPAAGVRLSDWRVDETESLSDHLFVRYNYRHEAAGVRNFRPRDKKLLRWKVNSLDEDYLAAALISGEWTGGTMYGGSAAGADCVDKMVKWAQSTLKQVCDMAMPRVRGQTCGSKSTY
ncbi:uncharacterized protein LOC124430778 [Vespa crabro]|uniref:uncharacterized protein LOC124430778 n=1 Tax=Vespa crabro TaxID=7445 RepID=UPI001F009B53|nr:uncharacterized protein LOC124430778 [Vespa crabro]